MSLTIARMGIRTMIWSCFVSANHVTPRSHPNCPLTRPMVHTKGRTLEIDPEMVVAGGYLWWGVLGKYYREGLVRLGPRSV